ncbi:uncharacterized protein [Dysidea avara]|uniref:uncharacterized protein n=1 Tax=Dysidea avara TaxID=196820 RepID=UPI00331E450E
MCLCMCCSQVGINWNKCACALSNNCPGFPYFRREGMTKGKKRKGATRTDSQEASGKYVPQFNKKLKINSEPEDSEQFEDIAITDGKAEVSAGVTKGDGLKSTENGTNEIASNNPDSYVEDTVTAPSNKDTSVSTSGNNEKESPEVTGDVTQKPLSQDTTVIVSESDTVEQPLQTVTSNELQPVEIVNETLVNLKASTNDNSSFPAVENEAVMIVEVAANPTVEQQGEEATFNKSTTKFIDVGIQVDLPTNDTSVQFDGNKTTSDPTVTALLDELSSLNRLIMASKRDLEATRRKRDIWIKNNKTIK